MFLSLKGRTKKTKQKNSPEQKASNLEALKSVGIEYITFEQYNNSEVKKQIGIGLIQITPLKKSRIRGNCF